ncbi:MAG: alpha/beta hydrolase, partial [Kiritimatiellia bacterium]
EDFARLHLRVSAALQADSTVTFWMKIEGVTEVCPGINLFEAVDESRDYLSVEQAANAQVLKQRVLEVDYSMKELPRILIKPNGQVTPFIFEGRGAGQGRLALIAKRGNLVLAETAVTLEIKPIEWFYDRYSTSVSSPEGTDPWNVTISQTAFHEYTAGYSPASDEVFLLVHGWNMSEYEKRRWAETSFKRLWWQGYRGRVVLFSWPTLELPDFFDIGGAVEPRNFDNSEIRAWRSATALAGLYQTLGPANLRVMAHSMGNVVASEALRLNNGPPIHSYIACQAALSAQYFDNTVASTFPCPLVDVFGIAIAEFNTPDIMGHYHTGDAASIEYFSTVYEKAPRLFGYYNPQDWALIKWQLNNIFKPADYNGFDFGYLGDLNCYNPSSPGSFDPARDHFYRGNPPTRYPMHPDSGDERYKIFAFAAESRSVAMGSTFNSIFSDWDLPGYDSQHYSHSKQFRSNIVDQQGFWGKAFNDCNFSKTPNQ